MIEGNTARILAFTALVLFMTLPGLALLDRSSHSESAYN